MFFNSIIQANNTREIGDETEEIAYKFLKKNGLTLITKNFNHKIGEIDLIMEDNNTIVFIEVKYRKNTNYGHPAETVTLKKQQKIKSTAQIYISKNTIYKNVQPRFDVIAMTPKSNSNDINIDWIKNAF